MQPTSDTTPTFHELDYRANDGIEVSLLWNPSDNSLALYLCDTRRNETLELRREPQQALDAFRHPFAYAAAAEGGACTKAAHRCKQGGRLPS